MYIDKDKYWVILELRIANKHSTKILIKYDIKIS